MKTVITTIYLILIVFSALAHGTVEPWSVLVFEIIVAILVLLWMIRAVIERRLTIRIPTIFWPLAGFGALALIQSLSYTAADGVRKSLSMDVDSTRGVLMMIVALMAATLIAGNYLNGEEPRYMLMKFFTIYGFALALFGIIQFFGWNDRYFWLRPADGESTPFGPFANRNHFTGYMEMLLAWPVTALLQPMRRKDKKFLYGIAAAWIGAAAIFTMSRGGMIAITAELFFIAALSGTLAIKNAADRVWPRKLREAGAVLAILAAIISGVLWLGAERVVTRIAPALTIETRAANDEQNSFAASRGDMWRSALRVFRSAPLMGAGLGSFETAYAIYSGETGKGAVITGHAHNDYLQILADGGLIGAALAFWFIFIVAQMLYNGLRNEPLPMRSAVLACGAGIFGILVHSLFDFNLQLPSHSLLFLTMGVVMQREREYETDEINEKDEKFYGVD